MGAGPQLHAPSTSYIQEEWCGEIVGCTGAKGIARIVVLSYDMVFVGVWHGNRGRDTTMSNVGMLGGMVRAVELLDELVAKGTDQ